MQEQTDDDIRVFIADDQEVTIQALSEIINSALGLNIVGAAADGESVWQHFSKGSNDVDILLMDIGMPGMNGLEACAKIKSVCDGQLKIIVMTVFGGKIFPAEAVRHQADGFLSKNRSKDEIVDAIRRVYKGERIFWGDPDAPDPDIPPDIPERLKDISPKEKQVICLVVKGFIIKEAAKKLGIGEALAERLKNNAMRKLGAKSAAHLGAIVTQFGICN